MVGTYPLVDREISENVSGWYHWMYGDVEGGNMISMRLLST